MIEYDAEDDVDLPLWRNGSRLSEIGLVPRRSCPASMPRPAAMILAISMSKPVGTSSAAAP